MNRILVLSRSMIASIIPAAALATAGIAATAPAQAATTTSVTAATAETKALGATTYMWGTSNAPAGTTVCSQVSLNMNWSTSQCSTIKSDHTYTVELTYNKTTPGTTTFRAITRAANGAVTATSDPVTLTRGSATPVTPTKPSTPATPAPSQTGVSTEYTYSTSTNVRSAASTSSSIVGTLPVNTKVTGTISGSWLKVATPSAYAGRYISTTVLGTVSPAGTDTPNAATGQVYDNGVLGNAFTLYTGYNGVKVYLAEKALGMNPGPMDSTMDVLRPSLITFQKNYGGLRTDGVLDEATWNALNIPTDENGQRYPFTIDSWAKTADVMSDATRDVKVNAMINFAKAQLGKPYIWGGTGPMGYDCAGLLLQAARAGGMKPTGVGNFTDVRPASDLSNQMMRDGEFQKGSLDLKKLHPGDLVYYGNTRSVTDGIAHHVSMYLGGNTVIEAMGTKVQFGDLSYNVGWRDKLAVNRAFAL